jgi:hypothetical protein
MVPSNCVGWIRRLVTEEAGDTNPVTIPSGNPHFVAKVCKMYLKEHVARLYWRRPFVHIGDTWIGWSENMVGWALQPSLSAKDVEVINAVSDERGLGQYQSREAIPIGGPRIVNKELMGDEASKFHCNLRIPGVEGGVATLVHNYDCSVTEVLAFCLTNGLGTAVWIGHYCPELFIRKSGQFPYCGQRWEHQVMGTRMKMWFTCTSDVVYDHDATTYYEWISTDRVFIAPGVCAQRQVLRKVLDTVLVSFTIADEIPTAVGTCYYTIPSSNDMVRLPLKRHGLLGDYGAYLLVPKKIERVIMRCRSLKEVGENLPAIVDALRRGDYPHLPYISRDEYGNIWSMCRWLSEVEGENYLSASNVSPYTSTVAEVAKDLIENVLVGQPVTSIAVKLESLLTPYTVLQQPAAVLWRPDRDVPMPCGFGGLQLVHQPELDNFRTNKVFKYCCSPPGATVNQGMCMALFGSQSGPDAILPLGLPGCGSSVLTIDGDDILDTEMEYLTSSGAVALIVNDGVRCGISFERPTGGGVNVRPIVVFVDATGPNTKVYRVHYGKETTLSHIVNELGAVPIDLTVLWPMIGIIPANRAYGPEPNYDDKWRARVMQYVTSNLSEDKGSVKFGAVVQALGVPAPEAGMQAWAAGATPNRHDWPALIAGLDPPALVRPPGVTASAWPVQILPDEIRVYDGMHAVEGRFPPAHCYSNAGIAGMRTIKHTQATIVL